MSNPEITTTVIIPYKDCSELAAACIESLLVAMPANGETVLVDDGSRRKVADDPLLSPYLQNKKLHFLRHPESRGPAAARNTGIGWARARDRKVIILLDSDCLVHPDFVRTHQKLQQQFAEAACIGGPIRGQGRSPWARLDGIMSWFTSIPGAPQREVGSVYHIPTTNMSLKLSALKDLDAPFDEQLRTGEDVAFIRNLRKAGRKTLFCTRPEIIHRDRENFKKFLLHQYRWGVHTFTVRLNNTSWGIPRRTLWAVLFLPAIPLYALLFSLLNIVPWLRRSVFYLAYLPFIFPVYVVKGIGVLVGICNPRQALY